jgi:ElaB/YqjD/DUF883 family membrane-anchored ribosome-binding protein
MDQKAGQPQQEIEATREAMEEKIIMIETRVHEAPDGARGTVDSLMESFERIHQTVVQAKATVDSLMQVVEVATSETADNVRSTAALIEQVKERPWVTFGSAILVGYILGSLADRKSSKGSPAKNPPASPPSP